MWETRVTTSPATGGSIETPYGWLVLAASTLLVTIGFGGTYLVVVGLKPIELAFGSDRGAAAFVYSAAMLGAGTGGVLMGWWSDRRGMFEPAVCGATMVGLGIMLSSQASSIWLLYLTFGLITGMLGNGAMFSPLLTNSTRWFDRRRGLAVALVATGQSIAGALWPPLFQAAIGQWGWRDTFLAYGAMAICVMLPLTLVLRRRPPGVTYGPRVRRPAGEPVAAVMGLPPGLVQVMLCVAIVGCCVAMAMPMVHIVAYCSDLGFAAERGAEMLALLLACATLSRLAFGWLSDRIGGLHTILIGASFQVLALTAFAWIDDMAALYVVSALFGLGFGGIVPAYALAVRELFPEREAGWRNGAVFLFGTIGMALGGWLGGAVFDLAGAYRFAFLAGVAFNLVNLVLIMTLVWRREAVHRPFAVATS